MINGSPSKRWGLPTYPIFHDISWILAATNTDKPWMGVWKLAHASKIIMLPSGKTNSLLLKKAIEIVYNILYGWYLRWVFPLKMVMFHSYVRKIMIHLWICRDQPGWIPSAEIPTFPSDIQTLPGCWCCCFPKPPTVFTYLYCFSYWCVLRREWMGCWGVAGMKKLIVSQWIILENSLRFGTSKFHSKSPRCLLLKFPHSSRNPKVFWRVFCCHLPGAGRRLREFRQFLEALSDENLP